MWIIPSSLQSAFAAAQGCSIADCTPDLTIWATEAARSCTRSGKITLLPHWQRAWKKAAYLQRLSGSAISPNCQQSNFTDWWIASLPGFPAKTSAWPVSAPDSMAPVQDFSLRLSGLPPIAVRDSCFWRTSQASLVPPPPLWTKPKASSKNAPPPASWENWPTSGGTRNGSLYQRPMWVPAMAAPDGFALPGGWNRWDTPDSMPDMPNSGSNRTSQPAGLGNQAKIVTNWMTPHGMSGMDSNGKAGGGGEFAKQASNWQTPGIDSFRSRGGERKDEMGLDQQSRYWINPSAPDATNSGPNQHSSKNNLMLPHMDAHWPTPAAQQYGGTAEQHLARKSQMAGGPRTTVTELNAFIQQWPTPKTITGGGNSKREERGSGGPDLQEVVTNWPTPAARDHKGANSEEHTTVTGGGRKHMDQLANFVAFSPLVQAIQHGEPSLPPTPGLPPLSASSKKMLPRLLVQRLNPYFVEWLMGWPMNWTSATVRSDSNVAEMALFHYKLQSHLSCLLAAPAYLEREA